MAGEKWTKTAEALIAFVAAAAPKDRIWITFFESGFRDFAEKPLERDTLLRDPNFQSIAEIGTDGGTELLPALRHLLGVHQRFSGQRRSHIVLITDGQIGNEEAVLEEMAGHQVPVHSFGIDHAVNEAFLRQLSGQQRGTSAFLTPNDDLVRPVAILGSRFSKPVFTGLSLTENWELADAKLPDIHAGQVVFAPIRTNGTSSEITVIGKDGHGRPLAIRLQNQPAQTDLPKLVWMKHRIDNLLQGGRRDQAIELAQQANLVCRGTAFVAWDEAEKVAIAQDEVYQPSLQFGCSIPSAPPMPMVRASRCDVSIDSGRLFARRIFGFAATRGSVKEWSRVAQRAYGRTDARKLVTIVRNWAKHADDERTSSLLRTVLANCLLDMDAEALRRVLSAFLLSLPEPWQTQAASVLTTAAQPPKSTERTWRPFLPFP
jgi:Ca-activated chloride channel family protein